MSQSLSGWDGVFHVLSGVLGWSGFIWSQSLSGWDGVFHIALLPGVYRIEEASRNPFQGGMGFFTRKLSGCCWSLSSPSRNPFQGGMGFFTSGMSFALFILEEVAIPFRVGWGFSQGANASPQPSAKPSQSLSGWDGVFNWRMEAMNTLHLLKSQSLSGWDGVFHEIHWMFFRSALGRSVAIPFRVGWGFSRHHGLGGSVTLSIVAIPFRVGWGFSLFYSSSF